MKAYALNNMEILLVDDEPDILESLEEIILLEAPNCKIEMAGNYEDAYSKLMSKFYDLVILDIMGVRGFDLLKVASDRDIQAVVLTAHELNPAALKKSIELGARAYFPKHRLSDIVSYLEDVLKNDYNHGWGNLFYELRGYFNTHFGNQWMDMDKSFWNKFEEKISKNKQRLF